jgi:hypothetical protein
MIAPNEFWLALHALAEAYDGEGLTADDRSEQIIDQFRKMPPTVRRQVQGDLERLVLHMEDLLIGVKTAARQEDNRTPTRESKVS